jgi:nicotinate-nucleotide pyrophosphorylase (carboxylating)
VPPSDFAALDRVTIRQLVQMALEEDGANQDLTTNATVDSDQLGRGVMTAKQSGIVCGLNFAQEVYYVVEPRVQWMAACTDGTAVAEGATLAHVAGPLHAILRGERVALNFLQRLSGVATMTAEAVDAVKRTRARILDTRKTTPGLRVAERYAVRVGGGQNHRFNLSSGILVKDNHIAAVRARGGSLGDAVKAALAAAGPGTAVEIEVMNLAELDEAIGAGARAVLLDNFSVADLTQAAAVAKAKGVTTEASGGITTETIRAVAETDVDFISLGALTHSAPALDISLNVVPETLESDR